MLYFVNGHKIGHGFRKQSALEIDVNKMCFTKKRSPKLKFINEKNHWFLTWKINFESTF